MKRACLLVVAVLALSACASTRPPDHEKAFSSVAFSPDHSLLAVADAREIRVLDVATRKHVNTLRQLPRNTEEADPASFRHGVGDTMLFLDDDRIATTGMGGLVSIWDIHSGRRLSAIDAPSAGTFASTIDYSQPANRLIIGTGDGQVLLTSLGGDIAGPLMPVAKLEGYIFDLQFGPDGRYFASASMEAKAQAEVSGDGPEQNPAAGQIDENSSTGTYDHVTGAADHSNVAIWDAELQKKVGDLNGAREVHKLSLIHI